MTHSLRALRKSPGFAASAILILALGIGANTAVFGIVDALLLKPLPFQDAAGVVSLYQVPPAESFPGIAKFGVAGGNYQDWRKQSDVFDSMAALKPRTFRLSDAAGRPEPVHAMLTDADYFRVLRVQPVVGRAFTPAESRPGQDDVAVLSDGFAVRHFGSAAAALGQTLQLSGRPYRVIGVMPRSFYLRYWFGANKDVWMPLAWTPGQQSERGNHDMYAIARLQPGTAVARAQAVMDAVSRRLATGFPEQNKGWGALVVPLRDDLVGDVRPALLTLLGAVAFVLLIACANTANLVLVRTIARRKEFAIRAALGAVGRELLLHVILETTLMSLAGGVAGILMAQSVQTLILRAFADRMPEAVEIELNLRVLGFTFLTSLLAGVVAGLIAGWGVLRGTLNDSLKSGLGKTDAYSGGGRTRNALVVAEVASSLLLLIGAGLMIRSLQHLYQVDPGFSPSNVTTMTVPIPASGNSRNRFYELLGEVRRIPGVMAAGAIDTLPLSGGGSQQPIIIDGRPHEVFALQPNVAYRIASPGYLQTMKIPLLAGRDFMTADAEGNRPVVLISQEMARQFFNGENPLGKRLRSSFTPEISREVVGVVGDVRERGLDVLQPVAMVYTPLRQDETGVMTLVLRGNADTGILAAGVRSILARIDPELPLRDVLPMEEWVAISLAQHRFSMLLFVGMAVLAGLLGAVGIYSVLAYTVRRRAQEISIRMALGAGSRHVVRLILAEGMRPAAIGIVLGAGGALLLSDVLSRLVYGIATTDPLTFFAATALVVATAIGACLIPAWRAARLDPALVLRGD